MAIDILRYPHIHKYLATGSNNDPELHMSGDKLLTDTEHALKIAEKDHSSFVKAKCRQYRENKDETSASAVLGELRAIGEVLSSWEFRELTCPDTGSDFTGDLDGQRVHIEVHTPQGRQDKSRTTIEHGATERDNLRIEIVEKAPLGLPGRKAQVGDHWGCDNVQGEAVSRLRDVKAEEHQFNPEHINILWLDFRDTLVWRMDLMKDQDLPLLSFNECITSGAIWSAYYGKKNTPVYYQLCIDRVSSPPYFMEFNGRFQDKSLIDFAVFNLEERITVLGNPKRGGGGYGQALIRSLHRSPRFSLEHSWLPIPDSRVLGMRVCHQLRLIESYSTLFRMP